MANSTMRKLATLSEYKSTYGSSVNNVANKAPIGAATTGALEKNTIYAYTDGYTTNANGSNQGTTNGWRIKVLVYVSAPTSSRTITYRVLTYFARTDGYSSTNTLNMTMKATKANKTENTSVKLTLSDSAGWVLAQDVKSIQLTYPSNGVLTETIQITGNNSPSTSCKSIVCNFTFQLPSAGSVATAATMSPSPTTLTLGTTSMSNVAITANQSTSKVTLIATLLDADGEDTASKATILSKSTARTFSWTPPISWASDSSLTTRTSATVKMSLTTYQSDGSTQIGSTQTYKVTVNVPDLNDSNNPTGITISTIKCEPTSGTDFIINKSIPKITVTLDKSKARGAGVSRIEYTVGDDFDVKNGETLTYTAINPVVSNPTNVTVKVYDTRGRSSSKKTTITPGNPIPAMSITSLNASRGNGTGSSFVSNDEGTSVKVTFSLSSPLIKSEGTSSSKTFTVKYQYRTTSGSFGSETSVSSGNITIDKSEGTANGEFYITGLTQSESYVIKISASDTGSTQTRETVISTAFYFIELHKSGTGIGIGQAANENKVDIAIATQFHSTVVNSSGAAITSDEKKKDDIKSIETLDIEKLLELYTK